MNFNLINDAWIPVVRQDGSNDKIMPWQITERDNPVMEINAPRPDFQGALYQFMIGLLQTCFAPEDEDEWLESWEETPTPEALQEAFEKVAEAFELFNPDGAAFMQDLNFPDGESKRISALLIEAPGTKTIKDNLDHFIKRGQANGFCSSCVATALFSLQLNAPSGGQGHRVGLRGGGPLTTLMMPSESDESLWRKLWLNVLNDEEIKSTSNILNCSVLPWMGKTRVSDNKQSITTPESVHPLQMYWGMPRRIRLHKPDNQGVCDICGQGSSPLFDGYETKNFGTNYEGAWVHPLTPYRFDPKKEKPPLSLKGQQGGLGYRHWLGLVLQEPESGDKAATMVRFINDERSHLVFKGQLGSLWCFGFDMDNMKARCWYDSHFPIFNLNDRQRENLIDWAGELIRSAREVTKMLRSAVKSAWFRRTEDVKGDMSMIDAQFWQATETDFYLLLDKLAKLPGDTRMASPEIYDAWFKVLQKHVFQVFEYATMSSNPEDLNLRRIVLANQNLKKKFYGNKHIKTLRAKAVKEVVA
ncbi:MAG: type I-E CRISPR-associated protein Cse1/CasA [Mariprofundaceae bacterium]|nr:type I-E CRISPR-associated protein Cse1/CasA [Mariprofundaceae bacterium]